jgi:hypothetical protein
VEWECGEGVSLRTGVKKTRVKEIGVLGLVASEGLNLDLLTHLVLIVCFVHVVKEIGIYYRFSNEGLDLNLLSHRMFRTLGGSGLLGKGELFKGSVP